MHNIKEVKKKEVKKKKIAYPLTNRELKDLAKGKNALSHLAELQKMRKESREVISRF